jgi:fermentation-respiration switch protein FrsA (DUF1100 family)
MSTRPILLALGTLLAAAAVALYNLGGQLFRATPARVGPPPASLNAEAVAFASQSGTTVHGWLRRVPNARGSVLLLPGIRSNRLSMIRRSAFLNKSGYSTLLIDFQASGESGGTTITFGWLERFDVLASIAYLRDRVPGRIAVIGVSLGGAATLLAVPPLRVDGAILEAVYPSIDRAVINRLRIRTGPAASLLAPLLLLQLRPRLGVDTAVLRPIDHIGQLQCPVLIIGGELDRHTTVMDTQQLFQTAREPKQLWIILAAAHVDYLEFAGDMYRSRVRDFLEAVFEP